MTREEAIRILCSINVPSGNTTLIDKQANEAIDIAINALSIPVPQGLDRAAIDHVDSIPDGGTAKHPWNDEDIEYAFKAGAKWMAEQGMTKEAIIGMATKDIEINVSGRVLDELELGPGDKVIVQIRKK